MDILHIHEGVAEITVKVSEGDVLLHVPLQERELLQNLVGLLRGISKGDLQQYLSAVYQDIRLPRAKDVH